MQGLFLIIAFGYKRLIKPIDCQNKQLECAQQAQSQIELLNAHGKYSLKGQIKNHECELLSTLGPTPN